MDLLSRYKGRQTSSLSLFKLAQSRDSGRVSPVMKKVYLSARIPILDPMDAPGDSTNSKNSIGSNNPHNSNLPPTGKPNNSNSSNDKKNNDDKNNNKADKNKVVGKGHDVPIADVEEPFAIQNKRKNHTNLKIEDLPSLPQIGSSGFSKAFAQKMTECSKLCDYDDPESDVEAKSKKLTYLIELISLGDDLTKLNKNDTDLLLNMINLHVFRKLFEVEPKYIYNGEMVVFTEMSWPHLSICYQMLEILMRNNPKKFDISYIKKLIARFSTPDLNERNQLASLVIIYNETHVSDIEKVKKLVISVFIEYLNSKVVPYAVVPALTVLKDINDKCPSQVLEIYNSHLLKLLSASHFVTFFSLFNQILDSIINNKDNHNLVVPTVRVIMRHWPETRSIKQTCFLNLLTMVLSNVTPSEFKKMMKPVFKLYAKSACSQHYKVSSAAYPIWNKIQLEPMIMDNAKIIFPIVYKQITQAQREHWSSDVQEVLQAILDSMNRIDSFVFQELCRTKVTNIENATGAQGNDTIRKWATIARTAILSDPKMNLGSKLAEIQRTFMHTNNHGSVMASQPVRPQPTNLMKNQRK